MALSLCEMVIYVADSLGARMCWTPLSHGLNYGVIRIWKRQEQTCPEDENKTSPTPFAGREMQIKTTWAITTDLTERLKGKTQTIPNAGKDAENHSYMPRGWR